MTKPPGAIRGVFYCPKGRGAAWVILGVHVGGKHFYWPIMPGLGGGKGSNLKPLL
jgi:hypothetical protein